jgi:predicted nucleic acid-binding protein
MTARCFADTNLFLYAASKDPADAGRKAAAREVLSREDIGISAQVLQEFAHNACAKKRLGLNPKETEAILQAMLEYPVQPVTGELVLEAFALQQRHQISYWDAAIIAAARALGCKILYTEDLNAGQDYDGVIVQNPFADI